jgi:spore maturation protein CgeB
MESILIFKGDKSICYGILEAFSDKLRDALVKIGESVEYVDPDNAIIEDFIGKKYKAIVAVMETLYYSSMPGTGEKVFDLIEGPKFNFWFDYPAFYYKHVKSAPGNYYILTQDRDYVAFINKYYADNARAFYLPPGGSEAKRDIPFEERKYNLSFVGTYYNWENAIKAFNRNDETTRIVTDRYLEKLIGKIELTTEKAYQEVLDELGATYDDEQFVRGLSSVHQLAMGGVAKLFREEAIKVLIENGIVVDVFGDSWKKAPYADNPNLRIHPEIPYDRICEVYEDSKMTLNIMSWHKDAITERILDAMMAGCIVLSDETPALRESFKDGKEILLFSLRDIGLLPELVKRNIDNADMAEAGKNKAYAEHSWENRARELMKIIDNL